MTSRGGRAGPTAAAPEAHADSARRALAGALLVVAAAALWATFGIFAKRLYAMGFSPAELASVRAFVAFAVVLPIAFARGRPLHLAGRDAGFLVVYGVAGFALFELVFLEALELLPVAVAAALLYTAPAFVLVIAHFTLGERLRAGQLPILALVLVGVLLVTGAARMLGGNGGVSLVGVLLGLGGGLTYAIYTVLSKAATRRASPPIVLAWSFGAASLALALLASPIEPLLRQRAALPWLIGLGLVPTLIPYALFLRALQFLRAGAASMIAAVEPVIAALLAVLLLGERLHGEQGIGIAAIVVAAVLTERRQARG